MVGVGSVFAGYVIKARLGAGGMGVVYLARHPRLKRDVALKVLHDQWAAEAGTRAAFDREAELASQLDHPNIVQVYDRSDPVDPALWLSMRHIAGGDATALLAAAPGGLPVEEVLALITDTAYALDHAHTHGVLHRDVKPANLLIEHDPRHGRKAVLTDFGIARAVDSATTATSIAMSLPYAAPERFGAGPVDHRADLYSLGCTMFQLFTGQVPFPARAPLEFMTAHLSAPVPSVRVLRPDLPVFLDAVIATVLAKNPADRYPSGQDLVADLRRAVTATTLAPPHAPATPPTVETDRKPSDTRGAHVADPHNPEEMFRLGYLLRQQGKIAEAEIWYRKAADTGHAYAMNGLGFLLEQRGDLTEAEGWYRKAADTGHARAMNNLGFLLKRRGELVEAETWYRKGADTGNVGAMNNLGFLLKRRGDLTEAETWYRKSADTGHAYAMNGLGFLLEQRGDLTEAEGWYRKAADTGHARAMNNLGFLLKRRGELVEAETWYRKGADTGNVGAMNNLGFLLEDRGDLTEAEGWYRKSADTGNAYAMNNLGFLLEQRGDLTEAEGWYCKAADTGHARAMNNLGFLLKRRGELADAETWYRKSADTGNADAMNNLGLLLKERGDLTEAETWYRKAADSGHAGAMNNLGFLLKRRGELIEAESWFQRARAGNS
ncbi:tetratricopeptide repeat protein [Nocardia sp. SYP-A9097]|uniref:tetratricopeptide repeat protein n=1 Tax=Nocardia sp. SYP-A9097 TaxID=2663237 RepID=UPI00129A7A83|nr:tetratricopeptide repeat protein [Nocardia sp. SYP-A9097]MRH87619.1 tetratricopeptide repeat protein [Nocardia sp. SYP-A9097]